jgi:hypothetical protein
MYDRDPPSSTSRRRAKLSKRWRIFISRPTHLPPCSSVPNVAHPSILCHFLLYLLLQVRAKHQGLGRRNLCESTTPVHVTRVAFTTSAPPASRLLPRTPEARIKSNKADQILLDPPRHGRSRSVKQHVVSLSETSKRRRRRNSRAAYLPPCSSVQNLSRPSILSQCFLYCWVHVRANHQVLGRRNRCESTPPVHGARVPPTTTAPTACLSTAPGSSRILLKPASRAAKLIRSLLTLLDRTVQYPVQQHVENVGRDCRSTCATAASASPNYRVAAALETWPAPRYYASVFFTFACTNEPSVTSWVAETVARATPVHGTGVPPTTTASVPPLVPLVRFRRPNQEEGS